MTGEARGWVAIPTYIIRDHGVPPATRLLYGVILSYAYAERACTASTETLCADAGISRRAFWDGIKLLRERGLIEAEKRKTPEGWFNYYTPIARAVRSKREPAEGSAESAQPGGVVQEVHKGVVHHVHTEEEEQLGKKKPPLTPPQAGGTNIAPVRPPGKRRSDTDAYQAAMRAWAAEHFPGADPHAVGAVVVAVPASWGERTPETVWAFAAAVDERQGSAAWSSMLEPVVTREELAS